MPENLSKNQKENLIDFTNDKGNDEREKIAFFLHFLQRKGLLGDFADVIGESYGFKVIPENADLICFRKPKE